MEKPEMLAVSSWFIYFAVANLEASTAKVKELGGAIWMDEPLIVKGIGKILFGADPAGAGFALIEENFEM